MKNVFVKFTLARRKDFPEDRTLVSVVERSTARNAFTTFPDSKDSQQKLWEFYVVKLLPFTSMTRV